MARLQRCEPLANPFTIKAGTSSSVPSITHYKAIVANDPSDVLVSLLIGFSLTHSIDSYAADYVNGLLRLQFTTLLDQLHQYYILCGARIDWQLTDNGEFVRARAS